MDCNNYSYAPHMLDGEDRNIESYENDDMQCTAEQSARGNVGQWQKGFTVWASSYDGTLDICEFLRTLDAARFLYNAIVANFSDSAPTKKAARALINQARRIDKKGVADNVV